MYLGIFQLVLNSCKKEKNVKKNNLHSILMMFVSLMMKDRFVFHLPSANETLKFPGENRQEDQLLEWLHRGWGDLL